MPCWISTPSSQATTKGDCVVEADTLSVYDPPVKPVVISMMIVASSKGREKMIRAYKKSVGQKALDLGNNARNISPVLYKTVSGAICQIAHHIESKVE